MNILIMLPLLGLRARGVNRAIRERLALLQALPHWNSMHGSGLLVLVPCGPGDVAAHNSLDG